MHPILLGKTILQTCDPTYRFIGLFEFLNLAIDIEIYFW